MQIKAIAREEIDLIRSLWEGLNSQHRERSTYFKDHFSRLRFSDRVKAFAKRDRFIAYVAEDHGEPVGYCVATVHDRAGEIDSLFLSEAFRGKGIGKALMEQALAWLEEQACETIRVAIAEGNEQALDFYRRFDFAERFIVMQRKQGNP